MKIQKAFSFSFENLQWVQKKAEEKNEPMSKVIDDLLSLERETEEKINSIRNEANIIKAEQEVVGLGQAPEAGKKATI